MSLNLSDFNQNWIKFTEFNETLQYQISWKSAECSTILSRFMVVTNRWDLDWTIEFIDHSFAITRNHNQRLPRTRSILSGLRLAPFWSDLPPFCSLSILLWTDLTGSCYITSGRTDRENIFNHVSTEMFVDHPYPRKRHPVTRWFPRILLHGNMFVNTPTCHNMLHVDRWADLRKLKSHFWSFSLRTQQKLTSNYLQYFLISWIVSEFNR
jgi:hypothetical protein